MSDYDYLQNVILAGAACGKSSLFSRFNNDTFTDSYIATIGIDFSIKTITVQNKRCKLQIWDTSGQDRFQTITKSYYKSAIGIGLCFDLTDIKTFNKINGFLEDIKTHSTHFENVKIILIGCKSDLKDEIVVKNEEINEFVNNALLKYGKTIEYFETSAKSNTNVTEAFEFLSNFIIDSNFPEMKRLSKVNLSFLLSYLVRNCKINGMYKWFNGINGIIKDYLCKGY